MLNMAGGVMENAGLCLDRFGVPYIPGSAIKGCARRMAIQNLLEAREATEPTDKLIALLADIALVFGWGEQDWRLKGDLKAHRNKADVQKRWEHERSDFAYACGDALWPQVREEVRRRLCVELNCRESPNHFAGAVSFMPAYPWQLPANDLELDVLTCHHPKYYRGDADMLVALDNEEPNPVVFLTVAAEIVFQFAVLPLRGDRDSLCQAGTKLHLVALEWLRQGLEIFGLGAKTAAGYGWFDGSKAFNQRFLIEQQQKAEAETKRLKDEHEAKEAKARVDAEKAAREQQRASLTPDDSWMAQFKSFAEGKRREIINNFAFDDEKWWPAQGELSNERIQFTILYFLLKVEPEFLAADRAKPKSKTAKALAGLKRKFPGLVLLN